MDDLEKKGYVLMAATFATIVAVATDPFEIQGARKAELVQATKPICRIPGENDKEYGVRLQKNLEVVSQGLNPPSVRVQGDCIAFERK